MWRRAMTSPIPTPKIHKSKSCPADFDAEASSPLPTTTTATKASPASHGTSRTSLNGSAHTKMTVNMTMTSSASGTGTAATNGTKNGTAAVPGRPRRRGNRTALGTMPKSKKDPAQSIRYPLLNAKSMKNMKNQGSSSSSSYSSLLLAVFLWYSLGVISITTSNLLMMAPQNHVGGVPPLFLTIQQLVIGTTMLRLLLNVGFIDSRGIQPWPSPSAAAQAAAQTRRKSLLFNNHKSPKASMFRCVAFVQLFFFLLFLLSR